jgi:uncharacterized protein (TIGR03435 family)
LDYAASGSVFETASIRVRQGAPEWKFKISGTRLTIESYTLFGLIQKAYNLQNYEVRTTGSQPLLLSNDTLCDVTAKAEGEGTPTRGNAGLCAHRRQGRSEAEAGFFS